MKPNSQYPFHLITTFLAAAAFVQPFAAFSQNDPAYEGLVVFAPQGDSPAMSGFRSETLSQLPQLASELGTTLKIIEAVEALPEEVTSLPAFVFQNGRGRSIFQGRNTDLGKIKHFVMTSRSIPQGAEKLTYQNAFLETEGRTQLVGNTKITPFTGAEYSAEELDSFQKQARAGIATGLSSMRLTSTVALNRTDRVFYLDFYPYVAEDGSVYISTALFSLFNCHVPVADYRSNPTVGTVDDLAGAFEEAAARLYEDIRTVQNSSTIGDGFEPVPASTALSSWNDLGLALPENPGGTVDLASLNQGVPAGVWGLDSSADQLIQFGFPAPLDRYQGVVKPGEATLDTTNGLGSATGSISVATKEISMGEKDLDFHVHYSVIGISKFGKSTFTLNSLGTDKSLKYGESLQTQATGTLNLVGVDLPVTVLVELTPILVGPADDLAANTRLLATASWSMPLSEPFGIEGPDGPAPANDTLNFFTSLTLKPLSP